MILFKKSAVAFFFLFFLHGTSIGNGQQGISYNVWCYTKEAIISTKVDAEYKI